MLYIQGSTAVAQIRDKSSSSFSDAVLLLLCCSSMIIPGTYLVRMYCFYPLGYHTRGLPLLPVRVLGYLGCGVSHQFKLQHT